ncbi:MAG: hypothetical protein CL846_05895 [Crocinitomicaceae bacterium]|nr:hypothetical protein [Crocinitomicaceae bacterium]
MTYIRSLISLVVILFFHSFSTQSQINKKWADFEIFNCEPIIENYLWAARTELTNLQYKEFLWHVKKDFGDSAHSKMLPDTNCWNKNSSYNNPYVHYYFQNPAYHEFPLIGITHNQAKAYCEWLTKILNQGYQKDEKHPVYELVARLPTEEEWIKAAKAGNPTATFPWKGIKLRNQEEKHKGAMMANFVRSKNQFHPTTDNINKIMDVTATVKSYWPNDFGLYCMSGNVAEMIDQPGRTKGGSWASKPPYIEINAKDEFEGWEKPSPMIGFRYFIEIIEFKNSTKNKTLKINAKYIESLLSELIYDSIYIGKFEVTNQLYHQFIGETGEIKHAPQNLKWAGNIKYPMRLVRNYSKNEDYHNHPVVNISKESAISFCKWLTEKYNSFEKKKLGELTFQLPTSKQWEDFARGGLNNIAYPWGGKYLRNKKGCFLCNYNPVQERWILDSDENFIKPGISTEQMREAGKLDGCEFTCPVDSYFPNSYGLYCISGNVAEMVSDKPISKGGSWGSFRQKILIKSEEEFYAPNPYTGFRFIAKKTVN